MQHAWSAEEFRKLLDGPAFDHGLWQTIRGLGWPDVMVGAADGGGAGTLAELAVLAEVAGAAAAPVPLAATAAANWCEGRCADGITLLLDQPGSPSTDGVSGTWPLVRYGAVAQRLLVLARDGAEAVLGVVDPTGPGVLLERVTPLDRNPAARICLQEAPIRIVAHGADAVRRHAEATVRERVALVAELVGIAAAANAAATDYSKVREAFGRPIGTYQAIKHRLVDQFSAIEIGRALVGRAADACDRGAPDAAALASLAAFWGIDALRAVPEGAVQVFGGIGYTWEHAAHVHLRRAACTSAALGPRKQHRDAAAAWLRGNDGDRRG